jgi:hypothetical protein
MKKIFSTITLLSLALLPCLLFAQDFNSPSDYMDAIYKAQNAMDKTYMAYMSAVAHSGRAKKIEKMRQQTIESISTCKFNIIDLPKYKGDNSLRQSGIDYTDMCYKIFNEDYAHIVNMEDIAEQSFDEMEAYLLLQEKTNEKIKENSDKMNQAVKDFAAKYNVTLINVEDPLGEKLTEAAKLNRYHDQVYLVFFKCNWEDQQMIDALNKKNLTNVEQARNALISYSNDGLATLDTMKDFEGDHSLVNACKTSLKIYKSIAENDIPQLTDFYLKQENFDKMKQAFDAKGESHTKAEVDAYNKAVKDLNASINSYNSTNTKSNNSRDQAVNAWNETEKTFLDAHMPYYK